MTAKEAAFEQFRLKYPGRKRGLSTEFNNFKKHKDWKNVLPLLLPAVESQIKWRHAATGFVPEWKNLRTWINQSCWEEEPMQPEQALLHKPYCFVCKDEASGTIQTMYRPAPICDVCRTLLASAPLTFTWKGQKISKISLDKGQLEAMILKQKAKR